MMDLLSRPWPWYVAGPLIGLVVPALLLTGNRLFGVSSNLRHICAIVAPGRNAFLCYDWKRTGLWNLAFMVGILAGGWLATHVLANPDPVIGIAESTKADLTALGITDYEGLVPSQVFAWSKVFSLPGLLALGLGGFFIGFGSRWAGGCTSGHAITGLADLQWPSFVAVLGFFAGGLLATYILLPLVL